MWYWVLPSCSQKNQRTPDGSFQRKEFSEVSLIRSCQKTIKLCQCDSCAGILQESQHSAARHSRPEAWLITNSGQCRWVFMKDDNRVDWLVPFQIREAQCPGAWYGVDWSWWPSWLNTSLNLLYPLSTLGGGYCREWDIRSTLSDFWDSNCHTASSLYALSAWASDRTTKQKSGIEAPAGGERSHVGQSSQGLHYR